MPISTRYLQGAFTHEMTHTQQLVQINRRLRQLIGSTELLGRLTDDVIQERFQKEQGFARLVERERDMLFRAAGLSDPALRRQIAIKALAMIRDRHARYYSGRNTPYAEIETLFLTMEGAGQWAAYKLIKARGVVGSSDAEVLKLVRDNRRYWSQDQGLALFLLLDVMVARTGRLASSRTSLRRRSPCSKKLSQNLRNKQLLQPLVHLLMQIGWRAVEHLRAFAAGIEQEHLRHGCHRPERIQHLRTCHDDVVTGL